MADYPEKGFELKEFVTKVAEKQATLAAQEDEYETRCDMLKDYKLASEALSKPVDERTPEDIENIDIYKEGYSSCKTGSEEEIKEENSKQLREAERRVGDLSCAIEANKNELEITRIQYANQLAENCGKNRR